MSPSEGEQAVALARRELVLAVGPALRSGAPGPAPPTLPPVFRERRGVFVTLRRAPRGELRGCIGFPRPVLPLGEAIRNAARAAATEDPRFPPVGAPELAHLTVEVSVLTPPEPLPTSSPAAMIAAVRPGRDGLIVEGYGTSGLLLPQVATEQAWTAEEFLEGTCTKAGLPPGAWRDRGVRVLRFEAEVFAEARPPRADGGEPKPVTRFGERAGR
jgi:uncharacterized protein